MRNGIIGVVLFGVATSVVGWAGESGTRLSEEVSRDLEYTIPVSGESAERIIRVVEAFSVAIARIDLADEEGLSAGEWNRFFLGEIDRVGLNRGLLIYAIDAIDKAYVFGVPEIVSVINPLIAELNPRLSARFGLELGASESLGRYRQESMPDLVAAEMARAGFRAPGKKSSLLQGIDPRFETRKSFGRHVNDYRKPWDAKSSKRSNLGRSAKAADSSIRGRNVQELAMSGRGPVSDQDYGSCKAGCWSETVVKVGAAGATSATVSLGGSPAAGAAVGATGLYLAKKDHDRCMSDCREKEVDKSRETLAEMDRKDKAEAEKAEKQASDRKMEAEKRQQEKERSDRAKVDQAKADAAKSEQAKKDAQTKADQVKAAKDAEAVAQKEKESAQKRAADKKAQEDRARIEREKQDKANKDKEAKDNKEKEEKEKKKKEDEEKKGGQAKRTNDPNSDLVKGEKSRGPRVGREVVTTPGGRDPFREEGRDVESDELGNEVMTTPTDPNLAHEEEQGKPSLGKGVGVGVTPRNPHLDFTEMRSGFEAFGGKSW